MKKDNKSKKSKKQPEALDITQEIRGLGVMIEHVDDKVALVAEQYGDIKKTLDTHTKILGSHTEMIGSMKMDVEIIKTDVEFIKNSLKRKVDMEEFVALERRVALLEKRR